MPKNRLPAAERREQIIQKAAEVFAQYGVEGTRTRDIAEACGINEALIYRHFSGKDELYREAMIHAYAQAVGDWVDEIDSSKTGFECILNILKSQLILLDENPVLCANMWHGIAATTHDKELKKMARDQLNGFHQVLKDLVIKGVEDGSMIPDIDPELAAWFIRGITWIFILRIVVDLDSEESTMNPESFCRVLISRMAKNPEDYSDFSL